MPKLTADDAVAIHRAIHASPLPTTVQTTEFGTLKLCPNNYGNASVTLPDIFASCVGANPKKDSKYGRKMRAGGAITLINPTGSKGWEAKCIVIESLSPPSAPTVASGLHFRLPNLLEELWNSNHASELNVCDPTRMRDDAQLKTAELISPPALSVKKRSRKDAIDVIDVAKVGTARCRACDLKIDKGTLRFGWTDNYHGHMQTKYLHIGCASSSGRTMPSAMDLPLMSGWAALEGHRQEEAYAAIGGVGAAAPSEAKIVD